MTVVVAVVVVMVVTMVVIVVVFTVVVVLLNRLLRRLELGAPQRDTSALARAPVQTRRSADVCH